MATKLGAVRSLKKPFRPRELLAVIAECLEGSIHEPKPATPEPAASPGARSSS
jgi:DNA-binding response OmpR family regulator